LVSGRYKPSIFLHSANVFVPCSLFCLPASVSSHITVFHTYLSENHFKSSRSIFITFTVFLECHFKLCTGL
jgi:hypothetical protein